MFLQSESFDMRKSVDQVLVCHKRFDRNMSVVTKKVPGWIWRNEPGARVPCDAPQWDRAMRAHKV